MLLFIAAILWAYSLATFDRTRLESLGDLGLAALLPWTFYAAIVVLLLSFVLLMRKNAPSVPLVLAHFGLLIAAWHATPALLYGLPRYPFTYKHIGIAAYIQQHGSIDPNIDAYFNWPAFFAFTALVSDLAGGNALIGLATWGPVAMNVLVVAAMVMLLRAFSDDIRVIWIGIWFLLLSNFVGQDYFAPQSFAYVLHLAVLGIYVTYFTVRSARKPAVSSGETLEPSTETRVSHGGWTKAAVLLIVIVLFSAIVASHQLTPFMTLASIAMLMVLGFGRARLVLVIMASILGAWFTYMAHTYFAGHLQELLASVGRLATNLRLASAVLSVPTEGSTSSQRALVLGVRQLFALFVALLAFSGWLRRLRMGWRDRVPVLLLLVPALMVALQPYGGEIIMRIYLFAVPFLALFAAYLFFPGPAGSLRRGGSLALFAVTCVMASGMAISYYGNESINFISAKEFTTLEHLYAAAPSGSLVVTPTRNAPIRHARYAEFDYAHLDELAFASELEPATASADELAALLTSKERPAAYLLITRSQIAATRLFGVLPEVDWAELSQRLARSSRFEVVYENEHGVILEALPADVPSMTETQVDENRVGRASFSPGRLGGGLVGLVR